MTEPRGVNATAAKSHRRGSMAFKRKTALPPTPEQSRRQADVVRSAWSHFGEPGPVIAFLNTSNDTLACQPLRLAIESDEGLERVEGLLRQLTLQA